MNFSFKPFTYNPIDPLQESLTFHLKEFNLSEITENIRLYL